jgi:hypothetical protein
LGFQFKRAEPVFAALRHAFPGTSSADSALCAVLRASYKYLNQALRRTSR